MNKQDFIIFKELSLLMKDLEYAQKTRDGVELSRITGLYQKKVTEFKDIALTKMFKSIGENILSDNY